MDEVFPQRPPASEYVNAPVYMDGYNVPRNIINPVIVKEAQASTSEQQPACIRTHQPLLLPTSSLTEHNMPITISLSPPAEETNGELVQRELFRFRKESLSHQSIATSRRSTLIIAFLFALVVILSVIFLVLFFEHM